jgi:hypothetical protein
MSKWFYSPGDRGPLDIRMPKGYCPHRPSIKQQAALVPAWLLELLYGGAAGGGKSDWLIMGGLQYVDVPDYAALILRRSFQDLNKPGAIMSRSKAWLRQSNASWNENNHEFTFPSGAKLAFGFVKADEDVYQYQSAEYQYIGIDELTQFTEFQYTYMMSRLRRPSGLEDDHPLSRVPLRVRAATNPGGRGHQWVRRRFVDYRHHDRAFIPAKLDDNPHIDQESYRKSLDQLDEHTRAQLLNGDWRARPPGPWAFNHRHLDAAIELGTLLRERRLARTDPKQVAAGTVPLPDPVGGRLVLGSDYGEAAHHLLGWPLERRGLYICSEHAPKHSEPDREAYIIMELADNHGFWINRNRFDASKPESARLTARTFSRERGEGYGKKSKISFNKYKRASILHARRMLRLADRAWTEFQETGEINVLGFLAIDPRLEVFIEQAYNLQFKNDDTEDLVKEEDHGPDALFAMLAPLTKGFKDIDSDAERKAVTA